MTLDITTLPWESRAIDITTLAGFGAATVTRVQVIKQGKWKVFIFTLSAGGPVYMKSSQTGNIVIGGNTPQSDTGTEVNWS
jgi:hypothetical protein